MAPPAGTLRVGRYFLALLGLLLVLYSLIVFPGQRHTPKLGIDLVGGIRVVFTALAPKGAPPPSSSQMTQARQILEDRINTTGVTGSTVVVQGDDQLVVEIPNGTGADVARLGKAAILNFRGIIAPAQPIACGAALAPTPTGSATASLTPSGSATPSTSPTSSSSSSTSTSPSKSGTPTKSTNDAGHRRLTAPTSPTPKPTKTGSATSTPSGSASGSGSASASGTSSSSAAAPITRCFADPFQAIQAQFHLSASDLDKLKKAMPNAESCPSPRLAKASCRAYSALSPTQQGQLAFALQHFKCSSAQTEPDIADRHYIACDTSGQVAYLLGHIVVAGRQIGDAAAQAPDVSGGGGSTEWTVSLTLSGGGADAWHDWTSKYHTDNQSVSPVQTTAAAPCGASAAIPCSDFVAFTLDGQVISSPVTLAVLSTQTSISGSFTQDSANELSRELNYGKLPLSFRAEENSKVSATLGAKQLRAAFIAGGIGLALVVIYSLLYYRGLGLVTIASLIVSGVLTYAMLVILATQIGFTLDLAGIAGFIVALGITADSFVVFFERIKDEVHEGRSVRVAVPRAWIRARRTILSADTVSFLAAAILYYFASANVKGFAFTLGMSTILDLVVVFLFTHPIVSLLSRSARFGSARFSGLASVRVGGIATSDDEPAPRAKRAARPAKPSRPGPAAPSRSATAVLEREDDDAPEVDAADEALDEEPGDAPGEAAAETEVDVGESDPDEDAPPRERRRSTPEPGTAAERAAARRARMRKQSGESGGEEQS